MSLHTGRGVGLTTAVVLGALLPALLPSEAQAQYFGRQKVQYETFDWKVMRTPHFQVHYYPPAEQVTEDAARMAERWYDRLSRVFQHEFESKPLILYADHPDFQQTNVIGGQLTEGTGGVTESLRTRVIMPYTGVYAENDHVLGHEMVHVFQYDMAAASPASGGLMGLSRLPLFLIEGMAEYLSLGRDDPHTAMWLRDAALLGELPTLEQMARDQRFFPYRYGQALWAYIAGRWGDRAVTEVFRFATRNGIEAALQRVLGITHQQLSQDWIAATREAYLPALAGRQRPQDAGDPILYDSEKGAMNLSPAVSPDGRFVAFFGRRSIFTVDLFVADAETGEIVRRLTSPNRSEHFDALSFIQSAGSWSPDGQRFAFPVFEQGDNRIAIMNVSSGRVERRIEVEGVGAIQNPAWSPDGRSIAFSGMRGGVSDLYIVELESGVARQITDDRHAALQPAWSPDGRTIVFATDRAAETDFEALIFGRMVLATYDLESGAVQPITVFPGRKHINPQYSPDGRSLYFVADPDGFSDVYRLDLTTNDVYQVTRIATGVSGITALSPAMSIAAENGRMLFSVFENSGNNIYGLPAERTMGERVVPGAPDVVAVRAGTLPPVDAAGSGLVHDYLAAPLEGLPPANTEYAVEDYSGGIGLDYLGPPSFGVGASSYGPIVGGGVSAYFGDMLGNHQIGTAIQANGTLKDIGGQAIYMNMSRRLNWGVGIAHIPYLTGFSRLGVENIGGQQFRVLDQVLQRIYISQASLLTRYPLSTTQRFEVSGGFTRYGFDTEIDRFVLNDIGQVINYERFDTTSAAPLGFFETSAALVADNSFFGFTSPVVGRRYRFEVSPTFGTLQYTSITADYRRYFQVEPFTIAFRGLHYGRYGRDASGISRERGRVLNDLFVGYEHLVRGYDYNSFEAQECARVPADQAGCPVIDRLFGTKMAVANFEFRIPLLGFPQAGLGLINFPFLPTEVSPFIDMGLAWSSGDDVDFSFKQDTFNRVPIFSAGVSARMNLFGYFVFETFYAYPFQRPDKGGHFGFQLMPGW